MIWLARGGGQAVPAVELRKAERRNLPQVMTLRVPIAQNLAARAARGAIDVHFRCQCF